MYFSRVRLLGYNTYIEHRHNFNRFFEETITSNKTSSNICDVYAVVPMRRCVTPLDEIV
jgi:hypothetical protein